ncbi:hypothetical protein PC129_g23608 [Phytophthora cactorum]|uniref:Uncharacterized protein n=2 Tax=Phytophthora cactorum TaxID=29920 RepID=A0A8T1A8G4_9STRA|nr:hypothetical protein PC115_g23832 [Phytophthora cactorum]KAG3047844.1 hypothetical protein PC122_g23990 [Phytophthora cactorum]KAG3201157.1 hypothetical protein PC129_g23608 [Phytophthora cactorum]
MSGKTFLLKSRTLPQSDARTGTPIGQLRWCTAGPLDVYRPPKHVPTQTFLLVAATSSQCPSDCGHFEFGGAARLCKKLTCRQLWCPEASPPMVGHKPPLDSGAPRLQTKMVSSETGDDECKVADGRLVPVLLVSALISASGVELAVRALACSPA